MHNGVLYNKYVFNIYRNLELIVAERETNNQSSWSQTRKIHPAFLQSSKLEH